MSVSQCAGVKQRGAGGQGRTRRRTEQLLELVRLIRAASWLSDGGRRLAGVRSGLGACMEACNDWPDGLDVNIDVRRDKGSVHGPFLEHLIPNESGALSVSSCRLQMVNGAGGAIPSLRSRFVRLGVARVATPDRFVYCVILSLTCSRRVDQACFCATHAPSPTP